MMATDKETVVRVQTSETDRDPHECVDEPTAPECRQMPMIISVALPAARRNTLASSYPCHESTSSTTSPEPCQA